MLIIISQSTIIQISRSLCKLMAVTTHFDSVCGIHKESIYHTCEDASKDLQLIIDELHMKKMGDIWLFIMQANTLSHLLRYRKNALEKDT